MTLDKLKPGMTVYEVQRQRMGNTSIRTVVVYDVRIIEIDAERQHVLASWNGNPVRRYIRRQWSKWRLNEPKLLDTGFCGQQRLARRGE